VGPGHALYELSSSLSDWKRTMYRDLSSYALYPVIPVIIGGYSIDHFMVPIIIIMMILNMGNHYLRNNLGD